MERKHIDQVMALFAKHLPLRKKIKVVKASEQEDLRENTDLVLELPRLSLSFRIRDHSNYVKGYGGEITFRCQARYGGRTEWDKMLAGWGDYFLYGFESEDGQDIWKWSIIDLEALRVWLYELGNNTGFYPGQVWSNFDGTAFRALRLCEMPDGCVVCCNHDYSKLP